MARFMNMDAVGGSRVRAGVRVWFLGWHPRLDGDFPFVDRRGRPWPFVEGGAMGPCGRSSIMVVGGRSH